MNSLFFKSIKFKFISILEAVGELINQCPRGRIRESKVRVLNPFILNKKKSSKEVIKKKSNASTRKLFKKARGNPQTDAIIFNHSRK